MPTSIPYDPSLVLGNLVTTDKLQVLEEIAASQAVIDSKEDELNLYIEARRSLDMTMQELSNLNIDTAPLTTQISVYNTDITNAATELVKARTDETPKIVANKAKIAGIDHDYESPIDYNRTQIKKMPLSADSLKLDAQYFSYDMERQGSNSTITAIKSFVAGSTSILGTKRSLEMTAAATSQAAKQRENHELSGTLIITATCTHKDALLLAPFILDVDKAIRVWNDVFPGQDQKIKTDSVSNMQQIANDEGTSSELKLDLLSGQTNGSSFVGMVHVLKTSATETSQRMISTAASLQAQMEAGSWFASVEGGFGVNAQFANDAKRMLSTQQISSHVSLITMGLIPTLKSNEVQIGVKQLADFDPAKMMDKLAILANATTSEQKTVQEGAQAARTGNQMIQIRGAEIKSVMTGLGEIDDGKNKMIDINSLMTAFEDYVNKAIDGNIGVPINYYLKSITRAQLAQMWVAKYYPNQYLSISGDDRSSPSSNGTSAGTTAETAPAG